MRRRLQRYLLPFYFCVPLIVVSPLFTFRLLGFMTRSPEVWPVRGTFLLQELSGKRPTFHISHSAMSNFHLYNLGGRDKIRAVGRILLQEVFLSLSLTV